MTYLIAGLVTGGVLSFFLTKAYYHTDTSNGSQTIHLADADSLATSSKWNWSDSLDAVQSAPGSHKVVFEDSAVRILQVMLAPNSTEPVHTHQWKSVMWFTQATPMIYYQYKSANNALTISDSIPIGQMPVEVLNRGDVVDAEGPHAIKNVGKQTGVAYRVV